jgi:hypothetical protein
MASAEYHRQHYHKRSQESKDRKVKLQLDRKRKIIEQLRTIKAQRTCCVCGEADPIVLEFDHKDQSTKSFTIGQVAKNGWGLAKIMSEVEKCDVICANCHRRRTAVQCNWHME